MNMDLMDFTMDNPQGSQQQNQNQQHLLRQQLRQRQLLSQQAQDQHRQQYTPSHPFHCQHTQPSTQQQPNEFPGATSNASREGQRYDPVYDTTPWYQNNHPGVSSMTLPRFQPGAHTWGNQPFHPPRNWQPGEALQPPGGDVAGGYGGPPMSSGVSGGMGPGWQEGRASSFAYPMYGSGIRHHLDLPEPSSAVPIPNSSISGHRRSYATPSFGSYMDFRANAVPQSIPSEVQASDFSPRNVRRIPTAGEGRNHERMVTARTPAGARSGGIDYSRRPHAANSSDDEDYNDDFGDARRYRRASEVFYRAGESEVAAIRAAFPNSMKELPSKAAIAALKELTLAEVEANPKEDLMCGICYNDYGAANPEGLVETPLQLPKCKHVFGSVCIKKWFEAAVTCPKCRDKLPVESLHAQRAAILSQYMNLQRIAAMDRGSAQRSDLAFGTNEAAEIWGEVEARNYVPRNNTPGDSPERRRQVRARAASGRPSHHMLGRPISIGPGRLPPPNIPSPQVPSTTPRRSGLHTFLASHPASLGVSEERDPVTNNATSTSLAGDEEASPAVVVGSFVNPSSPNRRDTTHANGPASWRPEGPSPPSPTRPNNEVPAYRLWQTNRDGTAAHHSIDSSPESVNSGAQSSSRFQNHRSGW